MSISYRMDYPYSSIILFHVVQHLHGALEQRIVPVKRTLIYSGFLFEILELRREILRELCNIVLHCVCIFFPYLPKDSAT